MPREYKLGKSTIITKKRELKPILRNNGYYYVSLSKGGKRVDYAIHKLVAQTFLKQQVGKNVINHKDENKANNCIENLEWCTNSYNCNYGTRNLKIANKIKRPILQFDKNFNLIKRWDSAKDVENVLNISRTHIGSCANGKRKTAGGYIWKHEKSREETIIEIKELIC